MGAGGSSNKPIGAAAEYRTAPGTTGTASAAAAAGRKPANANATTAAAAAARATPKSPVPPAERGSFLRVITRHLQPGETLSYDVGRVTDGSAVNSNNNNITGSANAAGGSPGAAAGLPPPPPGAAREGTLFGWFVEDPDRPGSWEPYNKESADRLEDAFLHLRDTCTVVMKKHTYAVNLVKMIQVPSAGSSSSGGGPSGAGAASRTREVKRVPVVQYTDPATGEVKVKEVPVTLIDPFAEGEDSAEVNGQGIAQGAGDTVGSARTPVYEGSAEQLSGLPHLIRTIVPHQSAIYTMETTPNIEQLCAEARAVAEPAGGALVLSSGKDRQLLEWSLDTAQVVTKYELPGTTERNSVLTATYSATGKWMMAGLDDRTARLYAIGNPNEIHRLEGHTHKVYGAGVLAGDLQAVTAGMDCRVKLWDISTGTCVRTAVPHTSHIFCLRPHPTDPNFALTAGEDRNVCMHDFRQENPVVGIFTGQERTIWDADWNPSDSTFASCGMDNTIRIYDPRVNTAAVQTLRSHARAVHSLKYTPRGRALLSCSKDFNVHLTDTSDWRVRWQAKAHAATVFRVRYHAGKEIMLTAASDSSVNVWLWKAVNQL